MPKICKDIDFNVPPKRKRWQKVVTPSKVQTSNGVRLQKDGKNVKMLSALKIENFSEVITERICQWVSQWVGRHCV